MIIKMSTSDAEMACRPMQLPKQLPKVVRWDDADDKSVVAAKEAPDSSEESMHSYLTLSMGIT